MKKRYVIFPIIFVVVLAAIIVGVAIALNARYLKKLSYDHIDTCVYNGVEVVGDDGLFYLVKDGKKVSDGYASLQSVNDYYSTPLATLAATDKEVVLFDYYIARASQTSGYLLVNSEGDEFVIAGDSYSLDTEATSLPYLVFTNNASGLKAVISLYRLDSDVSYKSGNELTLRTFKEVTPISVCDDDPLCSYLLTSDVSDNEQISYFRQDGIKISTGKDISVVTMFKENEDRGYPFFHNSEDENIISLSGELIASGVERIVNVSGDEWAYAMCKNAEKSKSYAVVFSPDKYFTLSGENYNLVAMNSFGNCLIAKRGDGKGQDVINAKTAKTETYTSVFQNGTTLKAKDADGNFIWLDENGASVMTSKYSDMTPNALLSADGHYAFSSASYDSENRSTYLHFARAGAETYTLDLKKITVEDIGDTAHASYLVTLTESGRPPQYAVLAPFSAAKMSQYYDSLEVFWQNGISYALGASYSRGVYDIIDPLTAKAVSTFTCSEEDFAKLSFSHVDNIALATDMRDESTAVHMSIITLSKYDADDLKNGVRYFAVYRCAPIADDSFDSAVLKVDEIGKDLLIDLPYNAITQQNYLITYTATGSEIFSFDEYFELSRIATLPYHAVDVISDITDNAEQYFLVETHSGMQGLYNRDSEEVLAPYYSEILYAEDGYFVVGMRGAYGVITATANKTKTVVDFLYSSITPLGDNGYLAVTGEGDTVIYAGKKMVMSESVQSVDDVFSFSVDEDGSLSFSMWSLLSVNGDLYIHRSEKTVCISFEDYDGCDATVDGDMNYRAQVIYYYEGTELKYTDVIYPDETPKGLYGYEIGKQWYFSNVPSEQTEVATVSQLFGKNIIKLYAKGE